MSATPPLTPAELAQLRGIVDASNTTAAAAALGVPRSAVLSAIAGLGVRDGSILRMREALVKTKPARKPRRKAAAK